MSDRTGPTEAPATAHDTEARAAPTAALTAVSTTDEITLLDDVSALTEDDVGEILRLADTLGSLSLATVGPLYAAGVLLGPPGWLGILGPAALLAGISLVIDGRRVRAVSRSLGVSARVIERVERAHLMEVLLLQLEDLKTGQLRALFFRSAAKGRAVLAPRVLARLQASRPARELTPAGR